MTIATDTARTGPYTGNGSTDTFAYTFKCIDEDHLVVTLTTTATEVEVVQTLTTHYTVTGVGDEGGGNVVMVTPPASTETLTITRAVTKSQPTDLVNRGAVQPETLETAFDRSVQMIQDLNEVLARAVTVPVSSSTDPAALLAQLTADALSAASSADDAAADAVLTAADVVTTAAYVDEFNDLYLGSKSSAPTLDNDGDALQDGALYYDTTLNAMYVYDLGTTTWLAMAALTETSTNTFTNKTMNSTTNFIHADAVHIKCRNVTGGTLSRGTAVYASAYNSGQDAIEVTETDADTAAAMPGIGVIDEDIANNANGAVMSKGVIKGDATYALDTSAWAVGDELYVSETAGTLTNVRPTATTSGVQKIGTVLRSHASLGYIFVNGAGRVNDKPNANMDKGADIASATTLTVGTDGEYFDITGTTAITGLTVAANRMFILQFDGALTFTHGASLNLPGAANITTAAGDEALCFATAADTVRVINYQVAATAPGGGGADDILIFEYQTAHPTNGGTITAGSWQTYPWSHEVLDDGGHGSISSNQITLAAGTYEYEFEMTFANCNCILPRLYDTTNTAVLGYGVEHRHPTTADFCYNGGGRGVFTIAGSTVLEVQYFVESTVATKGLGVASQNFSTNNRWGQIRFRKVA
jgi:hypothetical protein